MTAPTTPLEPTPDHPRAWDTSHPTLTATGLDVPHETAGTVRSAIAGWPADKLMHTLGITRRALRERQELGLGLRNRASRLGHPIHEPYNPEVPA